MPTTNFLQWNPGSANQDNDSAYSGDSQRSGGAAVNAAFSSPLANKLFYQCTTMMVAVANFIVNQGVNASDVSLGTLTAALATALNNFVVAITGYSGGSAVLTAFIQGVMGYAGGYVPVQQGGGPGMDVTNPKINIGATSGGLAPVRMAQGGRDLGPLTFLSEFSAGNQSLAGNGYQNIPGGLILEWFSASIESNTANFVNFPKPFPNACLVVIASYGSETPPPGGTLGADPFSTVQAQIYSQIPGAGSVYNGCRFIAIGF